jgi:hypothetical protein
LIKRPEVFIPWNTAECINRFSKWRTQKKLSNTATTRALIIVPATPGHFFQPGKNSLSLKQLPGLPKTPWRGLPGRAKTMIMAHNEFHRVTVKASKGGGSHDEKYPKVDNVLGGLHPVIHGVCNSPKPDELRRLYKGNHSP